MDERTGDLSVYNLVTKLCENVLTEHNLRPKTEFVKRLRKRAYEILLSQQPTQKDSLDSLGNTLDIENHILSWKFTLIDKYGLRNVAEDIENCVQSLQKSNVLDKETLESILRFFLLVKQPPDPNLSILESTVSDRQTNFFRCFDESKFNPPKTFICSELKYKNESFQLVKKRSFFKRFDLSSVPSSNFSCQFAKPLEKEESVELIEPENEIDIWESVSKTVFKERRTWETLGNPTPEKEPPFLSESAFGTSDLIKYETPTRTITHQQFIKDIKYILVGITSYTFIETEEKKIILAPEIMLDGIGHSDLESYCDQMIFCGTCYRALSEMASQKFQHKVGHVFRELCKSINRYLSFYRLAALSLPQSKGLLKLHDHITKLAEHLQVLTLICKVGPFQSSQEIPHGVALLNYLALLPCIVKKDLIRVLYSVLYPCLQDYFNRFLMEWIMEGIISDTGEFFITTNYKYLNMRTRTYWTKSFAIAENIVPNFLSEFKTQILNCGKAMSLLKLCIPNSPLCSTKVKRNLLQCCVSSKELEKLESNVVSYYLEMLAENGTRFSIKNYIMQTQDQQISFLNLVAAKRAVTLRRIELEKMKMIKESNEKKYKEMQILREQFEAAIKEKEAAKAAELEEEMKINEEVIRLRKLEEKIIKEEAEDMIDYYSKLIEETEKKTVAIKTHIENWSKVDLSLHHSKENILTREESNSGKEKESKTENLVEENSEETDCEDFHSLTSLDLINANVEEDGNTNVEKEDGNANVEEEDGNASLQQQEINESDGLNNRIEALTELQKNKLKVLNIEMGIDANPYSFAEAQRNKLNVMGDGFNKVFQHSEKYGTDKPELTEAQRNKLKVMSVEMGIINNTKTEHKNENAVLTDAQRNKIKVMSVEMGIEYKENCEQKNENVVLTDAQRNKIKVMSVEMGIVERNKNCEQEDENVVLTEAQRNKIKVLGTDIGQPEELKVVDVNRELTEAERNKIKVMSVEMGIEYKKDADLDNEVRELTDAQKNKIKVMSTDLGKEYLEFKSVKSKSATNTVLTAWEINRNSNMKTNECLFKPQKYDNDNFLNNIYSETDLVNENFIIPPTKKPLKLDLNLNREKPLPNSLFGSFMKSPNFEFSRPMSVDSTPLTEYSPYPERFLDTASTATTNFTEDGFNFQEHGSNLMHHNISIKEISNRISKSEAKNVSTNCLNYFMQQSVSVALLAQNSLLQNELLKHFIVKLEYLKHLKNLRNYFFLLDGEFGRNMMEGLFAKLYDVNYPEELINCSTLKHLIDNALDFSSNANENSKCLSFKFNELPKRLTLRNICILDCLSLSYKVEWPLNILLPEDTIMRYDEVFRFLLKLHRTSWVLKKIFMDLKVLGKQTGRREGFLMLSPQYQKLQQHRHIMTHFVQTLQNYFVAEVLQTRWYNFEENLQFVENIDQLYTLHTNYLKNILFLCLLKEDAVKIRTSIYNIFSVILKYYDYLRSRSWQFDEDAFIHPNFNKLEVIFQNFLIQIKYFLKLLNKLLLGYQQQLVQLSDMLSVNDFYSKLLLNESISIN